ncbi:MAG: type II toxin-antitoxin system RelE/ParE family toxin [Bacteroidota bacterium]|nr:type II toxin-antitoxin system RelE/ParE family toxin [Bacteroidota bacterium]
MNVLIDRSFEKDSTKIKDKLLLNKIAECIDSVCNASGIQEIKSLKKLIGYTKEYRIRLGDYRLGILIEKDTVEFIRCLHRKDIYKYFPK